ncbi:MAG: hypothetical protein HC929_25115 [Leptolyngbyaceae cyanobacterium SM2_5_2]|nr:hypothetical protein [Leptolyngbyaceae cyanobacterium SM2_5_2]
MNYGIHYRNIQDPEVGQPTWQIHVAAFDRVLAIPPEQPENLAVLAMTAL